MEILIIDNDVDEIEGIKSFIRDVFACANIVSSYDSAEITNHYKNKHLDVIFINYEIKKMDCQKLVSQARRWQPKVNIIYIINERMKEISKNNQDGFLFRPIKKEDVEKELRNLRIPALF